MAAHRPRGRVPLVTLTTDIGAAYAAQMKAVLARLLPPGHVVDLAHDLPPHAIAEAAFLLRAMAVGFPAGTVHVAVVDPGVGSARAPIVVRCRDGSVLVGPDNGVLDPLARALGDGRTYRIAPERLATPPRVGATFDGRDVFAWAAGAIALGRPASALGPGQTRRRLELPRPRRRPHGADGEVLHADRFGNLVSNVPTDWLPHGARTVRVTVGRAPARSLRVVTHYAALGAGRLGVVGSSFGLLELARSGASAAARLRAGAGTPVRFRWLSSGADAPHTVNSAPSRRRA
ncbi:MAG TPA: SAM-dependent chlorinase/fluorinase [Thermoplasmata archaeon]|nr:SAM-dependent chlorinase/fluorinase [Thermoplasmata archaeon]